MKQNHGYREQTGGCQDGEDVGGRWNGMLGLTDVSFCVWVCVYIYIYREREREWINNKVLLYRTGNYVIYQYQMMIHNGKESK